LTSNSAAFISVLGVGASSVVSVSLASLVKVITSFTNSASLTLLADSIPLGIASAVTSWLLYYTSDTCVSRFVKGLSTEATQASVAVFLGVVDLTIIVAVSQVVETGFTSFVSIVLDVSNLASLTSLSDSVILLITSAVTSSSV
jgi:hypothetical protein